MQGEVYNQSICLVMRAAKMYYIDRYSQKEIAEALKISAPTVSRLLKRAREENIICFDMPEEFKECLRLETGLKKIYHLDEIVVVPPVLSKEQSPLEIKRSVALEGARYLERMITAKDILGIAWGGTMYELIRYLNPCRKKSATFVTLHGTIPSCNTLFDVNSLVNRIAMAYGGEKYAISTPGLLPSRKELEELMQSEEMIRYFSLYSKITISVSGIGSFYPELTSPLSQLSYLSENELSALLKCGPYTDIMLRFLDADGNECCPDLSERTLAVDLETYRNIPCKILVASGGYKAYSLQAALKGNLADVLIIDYQLASKLLQLSMLNSDSRY